MFSSGVHNCIQSAQENGCSLYAIIEPDVWPEVDADIDSSGPANMILAKGRLTPGHFAVLPRIVLLRHDCGFIRKLIEKMPETGVLFRAGQATELSDIVSHLWDVCQARLPDKRPIWFRFYEPYVLHAWIQLAGDAEKNAVYGDVISAFYCPHYRTGELQEFAKDGKWQGPDSPLPLTIQYSQIERFDEALMELFICQLSRYLLHEYNHDVPENEFHVFENKVRETVKTAQRYGFETNSQIRRFAEIAAACGWDFFNSPPLPRLLENSQSQPEATLAELERIMKKRSAPHA